MTLAEQATIATLAARGHGVTEIARLTGRHRDTVSAVVKAARDVLQANLEAYARLHYKAATIAADKGDSKPAEWALERAGVVESPKTQQAPGVVVQVGVMLPGLGPAPADSDGNIINHPAIIDAETQ